MLFDILLKRNCSLKKRIEEIAESMASRKFSKMLARNVPNPKWVLERARWIETISKMPLQYGDDFTKRVLKRKGST